MSIRIATLAQDGLAISDLNYKAEEFVCLLERANLRNYWFKLKKYLCVGNSTYIYREKLSFIYYHATTNRSPTAGETTRSCYL